jgi:hypothetical protein
MDTTLVSHLIPMSQRFAEAAAYLSRRTLGRSPSRRCAVPNVGQTESLRNPQCDAQTITAFDDSRRLSHRTAGVGRTYGSAGRGEL